MYKSLSITLLVIIISVSFINCKLKKDIKKRDLQDNDYINGEIIIIFIDILTKDEIIKIVKNENLEIKEFLNIINTVIIRVPSGEESKWIKIFKTKKKVKDAQFNYKIKAF